MIDNDSLKREETSWYKTKEFIALAVMTVIATILYKTDNWNELYNYAIIIITAGVFFQNLLPDKLRYRTRGKIITPSSDYSFNPECYVKRLGMYVFALGGYVWGEWPPGRKGEGTIIVPEELVLPLGEHKYFIMGDPSMTSFAELPSVAQDIINDFSEFDEPYRISRTPTWKILNLDKIENSIESSLEGIEELMDQLARRNTELRSLLAKSREDYEDEADHIKRIQDDSSKLDKILNRGPDEEKRGRQ